MENLRRIKMLRWTDRHVRILKRYYPGKGSSIPILRKRFPRESIRSKAKKLKIKVSKRWRQKHFINTLEKYRVIRWGKIEIATLKREFPKKGINIKHLLKKFTKAAIKRKASILSIKRKGRK